MPPPIGAFLMPLYSILSWYGLCAQGSSGKYILPVAIIGWVWAGINILRTKRLDLGIVTFFFVILSALFERKYGFTRGVKWSLCVSSMLVAANYSLVIAFWKVIQKDLSKTQSTTWMNIFWTYCASMMVFWVCVAIKTYGRGESIGYTVVWRMLMSSSVLHHFHFHIDWWSNLHFISFHSLIKPPLKFGRNKIRQRMTNRSENLCQNDQEKTTIEVKRVLVWTKVSMIHDKRRWYPTRIRWRISLGIHNCTLADNVLDIWDLLSDMVCIALCCKE